MGQDLKEALRKYNNGTADEQEKKLVEQWYLSLQGDKPTAEELDDALTQGQAGLKKLYRAKPLPLYLKIAGIAAAIAIVFGIYRAAFHNNTSTDVLAARDSIVPGQEVALLKSDNNEEIDLRNMDLGSSFVDNGLEFKKSEEGKIKVQALPGSETKITQHLIRTPKGGEFEVELPDGSVVKLNAETELYFHSDYNSTNRQVRLSGEALFDIQKSTKPFIVSSATQKVTVLGTKFNIKAYPNEKETITKLLRGSVKVANNRSAEEVILKPGEQLINSNNKMILSTTANNKIDWDNSEFTFNTKSAEQIMNDIARWYNVEVVFENPELKNITYSGTISRYTDFNKVLEVLEKTGSLKFETEGRKITVR